MHGRELSGPHRGWHLQEQQAGRPGRAAPPHQAQPRPTYSTLTYILYTITKQTRLAPPAPPAGPAGFDPEALASGMRRFVEMAAGLEGAELPGEEKGGGAAASGGGAAGGGGRRGAAGAAMDLDAARFAAELEAALGLEPGAGGC